MKGEIIVKMLTMYGLLLSYDGGNYESIEQF